MDIAFGLIVPIFLGFFIGQHLDQSSGSNFPKWTIICTIIGMITGMWGVYKRYIMQ